VTRSPEYGVCVCVWWNGSPPYLRELDEQGHEICIGSGSFGTVIRANLHGEPVCAKLFSGIGATAAAKAEFEKELDTHLSLRHPRNVGAVLEYVVGGNLRSRLRRGRGALIDWFL
jgi:hypothetical protein